ncbi:MAG: UvrD-helicase domain-containing protein [Chloroflexota bacterium]|nr:UvrD-helicase domain-containing protein [Chloroflexota bacterium]
MEVHSLLEKLNARQCEAVTVSQGPYLILAGPGSGKTRVLTHRVAWMLQEMHIPPWQVLAVTFTNKAAREMRARLDRMVGNHAARDMSIGTFHATCARWLRREAGAAGLPSDYLIFDSADQLAVMKAIVKELQLDDKRYHPKALLGAVSRAKNELIPPSEYPVHTYYDEIVARVYPRYQETLRDNGGLDFDDLLVEPVRLFRQNPEVLEKYQHRYRYLLVDEFQDTNMAQYVLLQLLSQEHHNLFVVADEDQSIYSWRGADYRNIRRLRTDFPELKEVLLEENYRSTQVILDAAQAVIARNLDRTPKHLFTRQEGGAPIVLREAYDEREEAAFVAREMQSLQRDGYQWSEMAVMYRTNAQSRALEEKFVNENIPYRLIGGTRFYSRREVKDILAYLRLAQNPTNDFSFLRVVNVPSRRIGRQTLTKIKAEADSIAGSRFAGALALVEQQLLRGRTQRGLKRFTSLVDSWYAAHEELAVTELLDRIILESGYEDYLRDGTDEGEERWENILALRAVTVESPDISLVEFLTEVALVADVDELAEEVAAVTLMTLHSAKGLEYPAVFITGLEDGILPHRRSLEDSPTALAEERRLFYVGMTRAMQRLYLSYAFRRSWYGRSEPSQSSRFIEDLPGELLAQGSKRTFGKSLGTSWSTSSWQPASPHEANPPEKRPPSSVAQQFHVGERVRHGKYGEGVIQASRLMNGDEIVKIAFSEELVKQFLVGVAPLEALAESPQVA